MVVVSCHIMDDGVFPVVAALVLVVARYSGDSADSRVSWSCHWHVRQLVVVV